MFKAAALAALVALGSFAQARVFVDGGPPPPQYSRLFPTNSRTLKQCLVSAVNRHIAASRLKDLVIQEDSFKISKCLIDNCVKANFIANRAGVGHQGSATLVVKKLDNAGEPAHCAVYNREPTHGESLVWQAAAKYCNIAAQEYLTIANLNNLVVVNGCAYVD